MPLSTTVEDIVRSQLVFFTERNGWNIIYCEVCGDGSRTKGPRGGFLFNEEAVFYRCFNCGFKSGFDPNWEYPFTKNWIKVIEAFRIPKDPFEKIVAEKKIAGNKPYIPKSVAAPANVIPIPNHFYKLSDAMPDNDIAEKARNYLRSRYIDPDSYPFYLSTGLTNSDNPKDIQHAKALINRIIIPSFRGDSLVYYTARSMDPLEEKLRYLNAAVPRNTVIYGYDKLYVKPQSYLFVCEGFFDSHQLKGVAVQENCMSQQQIDLLERSPRTKIVIPDRKGDSVKLVEQAESLGWGISYPKLGDCKDVSEAIEKYGKLYVIDSVMKRIQEGRGSADFYLKW
jgi:hypothetical protein